MVANAAGQINASVLRGLRGTTVRWIGESSNEAIVANHVDMGLARKTRHVYASKDFQAASANTVSHTPVTDMPDLVIKTEIRHQGNLTFSDHRNILFYCSLLGRQLVKNVSGSTGKRCPVSGTVSLTPVTDTPDLVIKTET